jgi:hypothetical protein
MLKKLFTNRELTDRRQFSEVVSTLHRSFAVVWCIFNIFNVPEVRSHILLYRPGVVILMDFISFILLTCLLLEFESNPGTFQY